MRSLVVALALLPTAAVAQSTTIYDANGRIAGTASTSNNVTTFRDAMGRLTGTAERMPMGAPCIAMRRGEFAGTSQ